MFAMITGSGLSLAGIILRQIYLDELWWPFWLDGMMLSVIASVIAIGVFVIISLSTRNEPYDLDSLLNRNTKEEVGAVNNELKQRFWFEYAVGAVTVLVVVIIMIAFWYNRTHDVDPKKWITFWKWYSFFVYCYSIPLAVWFFIGGS